MKSLRKSTISATVGGQRVKIHPPGTYRISTVQHGADPEVWNYFCSRLRAVGLQITQLHPRDQILLYYGFADELEKKKNEVV